jgi:hypothetical protein
MQEWNKMEIQRLGRNLNSLAEELKDLRKSKREINRDKYWNCYSQKIHALFGLFGKEAAISGMTDKKDWKYCMYGYIDFERYQKVRTTLQKISDSIQIKSKEYEIILRELKQFSR